MPSDQVTENVDIEMAMNYFSMARGLHHKLRKAKGRGHGLPYVDTLASSTCRSGRAHCLFETKYRKPPSGCFFPKPMLNSNSVIVSDMRGPVA